MKTRNLALLAVAAGLVMLSGTVAQASKENSGQFQAAMSCNDAAIGGLSSYLSQKVGNPVTISGVQQYAQGDWIPRGYNGYETSQVQACASQQSAGGWGSPVQCYQAHSALCAVYGNIGPGTETGNNFVVYLPMSNWTGRYVQEGCGGECGSANLGDPQQVADNSLVTDGQLVLATTDMGHEGGQDGSWIANNPNSGIDFAYRGVHDTALVAKALINKFYGKSAKYSYFDGCSDGGREALMEAQRYPDDFNGIAAGSPANNMDVQNTYHHANRFLVNQTIPGDNNSWILTNATFTNSSGNSETELEYIHSKVLSACDGLDGIVDSVINDPTKCHFNTDSLVCGYKNPVTGAVNNDPGCLTQAQANVVKAIHNGAVSSNGTRLEPRVPVEWGSELDWTIFVPNAEGDSVGAENFVGGWLWATIMNQPYYFFDQGGAEPDVANLGWTLPDFQATVASSDLYSATNPDLSRFKADGGKLIYWAGWADQHIAPRGTIQYWESVNHLMGRGVTKKFARLYMFPGMEHCGDDISPSDGSNFDVLGPLMNWVEKGKAPYEITVTGNNTVRPVYPYPLVAKYKLADSSNPVTASGTYSLTDPTNVVSNFTPVRSRHVLNLRDLSNAGDYLYSPAFPQVNCHAVGDQIVCDSGK
ncbi:MAG: tannase/feruloyl esterase family alpha/beta hydrolase [Syntrophobacteraceae bacterium]